MPHNDLTQRLAIEQAADALRAGATSSYELTACSSGPTALTALSVVPPVDAPPPIPGRFGDLQVPQHLRQILALVQQPFALTQLPDCLLRGVSMSLHRGHPPILRVGLPQKVDHYPGLTSPPVAPQNRQGHRNRGHPPCGLSSWRAASTCSKMRPLSLPLRPFRAAWPRRASRLGISAGVSSTRWSAITPRAILSSLGTDEAQDAVDKAITRCRKELLD